MDFLLLTSLYLTSPYIFLKSKIALLLCLCHPLSKKIFVKANTTVVSNVMLFIIESEITDILKVQVRKSAIVLIDGHMACVHTLCPSTVLLLLLAEEKKKTT